ncbi:hypothetical protein PLESTB_001142100 [Pleodorina starrii]|uniref:Uncharacterized protein n=1 Tax=Pleodorina starrii TaxID=330485 RepID=A0A9W6BR94_9CHLO|nr:hypothetical protein PLESTM_000562500 [Pleodorina starrii]GLC56754.1 hypothetical protein PLESTB_001142100 [Pleodorina starrii]GLC66910.1 hypothetical protein PLESTF_000489400 [Pleodorina starrii]
MATHYWRNLESKVVHASFINMLAEPRATMAMACDELINTWVVEARKHGQRPHQIAQWIRRKAGTTICVWRRLQDGSLGCSVPCVLCRQLLQHFDLRVSCVVEGGAWWDGRLDAPDAPASKPTSGQRRRRQFGGEAQAQAQALREPQQQQQQQQQQHREGLPRK